MAATLGALGLVPFLGTAALALTGTSLGMTAVNYQIMYGASILSFMGGVHWGVATKEPDTMSQTGRYVISVMPSLLAVGCLMGPPELALVGLGIGFSSLLVYDVISVRVMAPWYLKLRIPLTAGVLLSLACSWWGCFDIDTTVAAVSAVTM
eukprot:CAMPEP_0168530400 /NCGR_PEP_ID=MMETSP0405-20121227/14637_1 /TAXON_ID=498012 /ORGANISM="Trichosphaerium sp, Strain Am-I-7 wt" /LENGTH=150 /DNA_ID=CAMNT_0008554619 /DNA_START=108 /DNA_END=560 /DNA_ORIENTATION=+